MSRKSKDKIIENVEVLEPKKVTKSTTKKKNNPTTKKSTKVTTKKATQATKTTSKKATTKKVVAKSVVSKKATTKNAKTENISSKEVADKLKANKKTSQDKKDTKKVITKKSSTKVTTTRSKKNNTFLSEYYDLQNHYEQTVVKILAQTPTILFVYWNISEKDIAKLLKQYGENFFYDTYPVLVVINKTKNYQFEVTINDYANSWYLHIPDSNCEYEVVLIRKNKKQEENHEFPITSSNQIETPNDHILFDKLGKTIFFKNVQNLDVQEKDISSFAFMYNIGKIYNIYDLYKEIYKDELNENVLNSKLTSS